VPIFHTVFAHVYHYAISELCKGLYHHNGVWHEAPRPQILRFRPQARAPPLGVCLPHQQRCGDGEVSGSRVSEGVCEALTFMGWSTMWWCRPTLKVAATPCRSASTTIRLCESAPLFVGLSETQRTRCSRLLRPIRLKPSQYDSAQRALSVKVAGGGLSVHACVVFFRAKSRDRVMGTNSTKPRKVRGRA
jgi:hypothetical protein